MSAADTYAARKAVAAPSRAAQDAFYTRPCVLATCVDALLPYIADETAPVCVDFSAGDGEFARQLCARVPGARFVGQYDTQPRHDDVTEADWFSVAPRRDVHLIGFNPPFGYQASTLRRFLAHAARFLPAVLCFVAPHTSRRVLPPQYVERARVPLRADAFFTPADGQSVTVRNCAFVVATYDAEARRERSRRTEHLPDGVRRVSRERWPELPFTGFAIRRAGSSAGRHVFVVDGTAVRFFDFARLENGGVAVEPFVTAAGKRASSIAFWTYETDAVVSDDFVAHILRRIDSEYAAEMHRGMIPSGSTAYFAECISAAASSQSAAHHNYLGTL